MNNEEKSVYKCEICERYDIKNLYKCPNCHINYCSLKCYKKPVHNDCENIFRRKELNKIINLDENNQSYEELMKKIKLKTQEELKIIEIKNENEIEDFESFKYLYDQLSKEKKLKFKEYIKECQNTNYNYWTLFISQPWWIIIYDIQNGNLVEQINDKITNKKDEILCNILPNLIPKLDKLSLKNMNKKSSLNYNKTLGFIIHRLILVYITIIRIYGNKIQSIKYNNKMNQIIANCILKLVSPLSNIQNNNFEKLFSSYEQLIEFFEIDIISYFKNDWNYSSFNLTEEFFIEIYKDYILILNEYYFENNSQHISLLYLILSDIYFVFYHLSFSSILKKLIFYTAWCKNYSTCNEFRSILNFLQFRTEYHKNIINNFKILSNEQIEKMKPKINHHIQFI